MTAIDEGFNVGMYAYRPITTGLYPPVPPTFTEPIVVGVFGFEMSTTEKLLSARDTYAYRPTTTALLADGIEVVPTVAAKPDAWLKRLEMLPTTVRVDDAPLVEVAAVEVPIENVEPLER